MRRKVVTIKVPTKVWVEGLLLSATGSILAFYYLRARGLQ